jgi:hypothetical protein
MWGIRYFVLRGTKLRCYKDEESARAHAKWLVSQ